MDEKLSWMPFYGRDFYESENVAVMGLEQEAVYMRLLWRQWREGSLPPEPELLAVLVGTSVSDRVLGLFPLDDSGRRRNPKLERVRVQHVGLHAIRSHAGKVGRAKQLAGKRRAQPQASGGQEAGKSWANVRHPEPEPEPEPEEKQKNDDDSARAKAATVGSVRHLALSDQMTLTTYRSALEGFLRGAHDPDRLLAEFEMVTSGPHGPGGRPVPPDVLGAALNAMALASAPATPKVIAAYIRRELQPDPPPRQRQAVDDDEGEFVRAGRKLEAEDAARRAAVHRA